MRKHTFRMLLTAILLVMTLGCSTAVYGITIAGGKAETGVSKTTVPATTKTTTGTTTGTKTTGTGYVLGGNTSASDPSTAASYPTTMKTGTRVQTGYLDDAMPFLIVMGFGVFALLLFSHMQLNQTRYGKSEKYAKELKDFRKACSIER